LCFVRAHSGPKENIKQFDSMYESKIRIRRGFDGLEIHKVF
jgi:hypothetical protein